MKYAVAVITVLLVGCVARKESAVETFPRLRAEVDRLEREYPDLLPPDEFVQARVEGTNGWPILKDVGIEYSRRLSEDSGVYRNGKHLGFWSRLEYGETVRDYGLIDNGEALMDQALTETFRLREDVDRALAGNSLVPVWDDGIEFMPSVNAFNMLRLRANIQIHRGVFTEARGEVRRMLEMIRRMDAEWHLIGYLMADGYRKLVVDTLLELTRADPTSMHLIDTALEQLQPPRTPLSVAFEFELAWALERVRAALDSDASAEEIDAEGTTAAEWETRQIAALNLCADVLETVRAGGWDLSSAADAKAFLHAVREELKGAEDVLGDDSVEWEIVCARLVHNVTTMSCMAPILKLRKLELAGGELQDLESVALNIGLPEGLRLERAEEENNWDEFEVWIVPENDHPALDGSFTKRGEPIASYPLLG